MGAGWAIRRWDRARATARASLGSWAQSARVRLQLCSELSNGRVSRQDDTAAACTGRCQLNANRVLVHAQREGRGRTRGRPQDGRPQDGTPGRRTVDPRTVTPGRTKHHIQDSAAHKVAERQVDRLERIGNKDGNPLTP